PPGISPTSSIGRGAIGAESASRRSARRRPQRPAPAGRNAAWPRRCATSRCWSLRPSCARLHPTAREAAMGTDYFEAAERSPERSRPSWLSRLILPVLALLIGAVAMAWVVANWNYAASLLGIMAETPPPAASAPVEVVPEGAEPVGSTKESEPERLVIDPEMSRRVQQLETRVSQI